jgi:hypothetical protein
MIEDIVFLNPQYISNAPAPTTLDALLPKFAMNLNIKGQSAKNPVHIMAAMKLLKYLE